MLVQCNRSGCGFILVYADDILLISRSVVSLQTLVDIVANGLAKLGLLLNVAKSYCLRVGQRFDACCAPIQVSSRCIPWTNLVKYLGVYIIAAKRFACTFDAAKRHFNSGVNVIISRVGVYCDLPVLTRLINSKCLPSLIYGAEATDVNKTARRSLDFTYTDSSSRY